MKTTRLVASILLCTHAAISWAQDFVLPQGIDVLTEEKILAQVIGNTYVAGSLWVEYYIPPVGKLKEGRLRGKKSGRPYEGSWSVKGPFMCWEYDGISLYDGCYSTALEGDVISWYNTGGKHYKSMAGRVTLKKGNPENL